MNQKKILWKVEKQGKKDNGYIDEFDQGHHWNVFQRAMDYS